MDNPVLYERIMTEQSFVLLDFKLHEREKNAWKNNKYEQDNRTLTLTAERPKVAIQ